MPTSVAPLPPSARPVRAHDASVPAPGPAPGCGPSPRWIGRSALLSEATAQLRHFARSRAPVLIQGESGTGKELAAAELHNRSGRAGPLIAFNCGALSEALAASQLFGHARGAFTGAVGQHRGAFTRAHRGTVFLDEIGELPLPSQALLLRVLETGRVCPVGAETETTVDARVVCATHRNLRVMVARGTFRADLFHRLSVLTVEMPALRDRPSDIDVLLDHFAQTHASDVGHPIRFSPDARQAARCAAWTGNVRELRNAVHRAAFVARGQPITADDLFPTPTGVQGATLTIPSGDYTSMRRALLESVVRREGSQRRAAEVLKLPRSTLGNWLREKTG
ncbi:MAG: sigma 54-interacting transcriptional regulator [Nannocystales bacterium]